MSDNFSALCEKELTTQTKFLHYQTTSQARLAIRAPAIFPIQTEKSYYCVISPWTLHKFNFRVIYVLYPWGKEWVTLLEYFNRKMKINWALCFTKQ